MELEQFMLDETGDELVEVAVPRRHLIAVYGLLAQLEGDRVEPIEPAEEAHEDGPHGNAPWSLDDLRRFANTPNATSRTIRKVFDVLAADPGKFFSTSDLEVLTQVPRANLKGAFSGLGRHVRKYYPGRVPMMGFAWGPTLGPDVPAEAHYKFEEAQADAWKEASKGI